MRTSKIIVLFLIMAASGHIQAQKLTEIEKEVIAIIDKNNDYAISLLEKVVNINSGSLNVKGVKKVGDVFATEFESIGFKSRWIDMPAELNRAGHLFCELNTGQVDGKKLLLIGHLDTVFEEDSPFQEYKRDGDRVSGPGVDDMKGGDLIIYAALKALQEAGVLNNTQIIVAITGDEEKAGCPISISRKDLVDAAKRSDIALGFEGATGLNYATVARRSSGGWVLKTEGVQAHSSGIFTENVGAGAIFEMSRILTAFYNELPEEYLTFNPSTVIGGTAVNFDEMQSKGYASGKDNIVPRETIVHGDIRCLSKEQIEATVNKMKAIVSSNHLPKTNATISFNLKYPPMKPTPGNYEVLKVLDEVSKAMGQGAVEAYDPGKRGAGDISFVAEYVDGLDGLGTMGGGSHTPKEYMDLTHFKDLTKRAALLIYRLINTTS
ncbi:M20/M25/M40 family metallo-hydrolase [Flavobacterium sp. ACAM 123]|uniref:M20/M25/M40 family metallo-hydrolase n=1 Tax=Flavobacterium sp. ACAM 123 TaxID=1189620 RepID=UPI0002E48A32|nr:M20/M25/M40 family metallo-hydrolase [Flavobacterium sp. ACAM 123]